MPKTDSEQWTLWMTQALAGDQSAYRELLQSIRPPILGFVRNRLRNPDQADDLAQTVLLRIHLYRHTYDVASPFERWMFSIARNVLNDHLGSLKKRGEIQAESEWMEAQPAEPSAASGRLEVESALGSLPSDQAEAIVLVKVMGLSMEAAASKLGISVSAMKVRAHRAYAAFKSALSR